MDVPRDRVRPLSEELSELRFVAENTLIEKLEEIRGLLAHSHPGLTMGELMDVLATDYLKRHHPAEKAKRAEERKAKKDQRPSEQIDSPAPARVAQHEERRTPTQAMTHELIQIKGYRCDYVDSLTGKRCKSQRALERDHIRAWSRGGKTEISNLRWLCRNHHRRISFLSFGESSRYFMPKRE